MGKQERHNISCKRNVYKKLILNKLKGKILFITNSNKNLRDGADTNRPGCFSASVIVFNSYSATPKTPALQNWTNFHYYFQRQKAKNAFIKFHFFYSWVQFFESHQSHMVTNIDDAFANRTQKTASGSILLNNRVSSTKRRQYIEHHINFFSSL